TSRCTGACGLMSRMPSRRSFSNTFVDGISPATMRSKIVGSLMGSSLRNRVPRRPVIADAVLVAGDPVRVEEGVLPAGAVVPVEAHARDGEVGPAVADAERPEVDVPGEPAVGGED